MISFLRHEPRFRISPPYGREIAAPESRVVELMAKAEVIDQRNCFIRYANADMAAGKATALHDADVQPHLRQPNGGRGAPRSRPEDDHIMLGGKLHALLAVRENLFVEHDLFPKTGIHPWPVDRRA